MFLGQDRRDGTTWVRASSTGQCYTVQGDHNRAIRKYTKALAYLSDMTSPDGAMAEELSSSNAQVADQLKTVAVPCLLNRAACCLKLQQPREAIMDCHNVLQTDANNTKALFRKGQAHVAVRVSYALPSGVPGQVLMRTLCLGRAV